MPDRLGQVRLPTGNRYPATLGPNEVKLVVCGMAELKSGFGFRLHALLVPSGQESSVVERFNLPAHLALGAVVFGVMVSLLAGLFPATRAARGSPGRGAPGGLTL